MRRNAMVGGRWRAVALAALALTAMVGPVAAAGPIHRSSDVTKPTVESLTVSPGSGDVSSTTATFAVALRVTDDMSGVGDVQINVTIGGTMAQGFLLTRTTGNPLDVSFTGSFAIPRFSPPGRYPFFVSVTDLVGNGRSFDAAALADAGLASGVDISDANPDATPPTVNSVQVTPATVDVRTGPADVTVQIAAADSLSGVSSAVAFLTSPAQTGAGIGLSLVSGASTNGVWRGTTTLPEHARAGHWTLHVRVFDGLWNSTDLPASQLSAMGLTSGFDVLSVEDAEGPQFSQVSIQPADVNVYVEDQTVAVRLRLTDNVAGVAPSGSVPGHYQVQVDAYEPRSGQGRGRSLMTLVSGSARDGMYEGSFVVPKSSATGYWRLRLHAYDAVGNWTTLNGDGVAAAGGPSALYVFTGPSAPVLLDVTPGDGSATVRWGPPADEGGWPVGSYLVRASPGGAEVEAPATARSAVVTGLANGTAHTFTVRAVNRAGASEPSATGSATPGASTTTAPSTTTTSTRPAATTTTRPVTATTTAPPVIRPQGRTGYWMVDSSGGVHAFGDAARLGSAPVGGGRAVDLEPTPSRAGYWVVDAAGRVYPFGDAPLLGSASGLGGGEEVTSLSATPSGRGYWLFTTVGRVIAFGDAPVLGDMSTVRLNGPVLDSVPTPTGRGYYMVAADGGVFSFGDARFAGSMGASRLNARVESLVPAPNGSGYWLVASDGGVFAFGAPFLGSMGSVRLNRPVTGMVSSATGLGYLMVAEDGGIFAFGDASFRGSLAATPVAAPITAVATVEARGRS